MIKYEMMYIVKPAEEEKIDEAINKVNMILDKHSAEVTKVDKWGEKALAYEISGFSRGHYVLVDFSMKDRNIISVDREMKYLEDVLRFLIIEKSS